MTTGPWQPLRKERISRRSLLKGGAGASVGAAGLVLVGCGDNDDETIRELLDEINGLEDELDEVEVDGGASGAGAPIRYPRRRIAAVSDLREGEPLRFDYLLVGQSSLLIKLGKPAAGGVGPDGDIVAFSELCTHMGCPIASMYRPDSATVGPCAGHFTMFDLTHRGMVVIGQATENLPQVILELEGDDVVAIGVNGIVYGYRDNLADGELAGEGA
jgi:arsenite oxidase small subunit